MDCFYKKDNQIYLDKNFLIPVYTIPGNHDYRNKLLNPLDIDRELTNYHSVVENRYANSNDNYVITYDELCLFFMNSGPDYLEDPTDWSKVLGDGLYESDIQWLENTLDECEAEKKIVLIHHPVINDRNEFGAMKDVIARNRVTFINMCLNNDIEIVLTGHTHRSVVFDSEENIYSNLPINCNYYSTLFIQTDDCKQGMHYRNISYLNGDLIVENSKEVEIKSKQKVIEYTKIYLFKYINYFPILKFLLSIVNL